MKIFTILKCLIRFLNVLFTILKFLVDVLSVMWRKFPLTEVVNIGRTAAKARSAQGASQFAAGNAAARLHQLSRVRMAV